MIEHPMPREPGPLFEVPGSPGGTSHLMPERRCSCWHWNGDQPYSRPFFGASNPDHRSWATYAEIAETARVAARLHAADGDRERARWLRKYAHAIERLNGRGRSRRGYTRQHGG